MSSDERPFARRLGSVLLASSLMPSNQNASFVGPDVECSTNRPAATASSRLMPAVMTTPEMRNMRKPATVIQRIQSIAEWRTPSVIVSAANGRSDDRLDLPASSENHQLHAGDDGVPDAVLPRRSLLGRAARKRSDCRSRYRRQPD